MILIICRYGNRIIAKHLFDIDGASPSQDAIMHQSLLLLLSKAPLVYSSVLLWPFDVTPARADGDCGKMWENYVRLANTQLFWFGGKSSCSFLFDF